MSARSMLDRSSVADAARAVRPGAVDEVPAQVFAAGAWTTLVEPGDAVAGALIETLGAAEALESLLLDAPPSQNPALLDGFGRWRARADPAAMMRAFRNAAHLGARLLVPGDADWPAGLADLGAHAPLALWCLAPDGPLPRTARSIAVVGSRDSTDYGVHVATEISCGTADLGYAIVSGAAVGVDGAAHRGALASGATTVAVLAGGLDRFYPPANGELLQRIAREGMVLSEMPCGARPMRHRFLSRNRLIAAMSRTTVVVEAAARSGAINTAANAAQLGRPLGVVPGSVFSATSAGCHVLLREYGAVLVRNAADVAELARDPDTAVELDGMAGIEDPEESAVRSVLARTPRPAAEVARLAGLPLTTTAGALAMLALTGTAVESGRGWARP